MIPLCTLVAQELALPVDPRVTATAEAIAALYPDAARAVLFYGSCLREKNLDGLMLDFYLIVSSYREAYGREWYAVANKLVPPNVFPFEHEMRTGIICAVRPGGAGGFQITQAIEMDQGKGRYVPARRR